MKGAGPVRESIGGRVGAEGEGMDSGFRLVNEDENRVRGGVLSADPTVAVVPGGGAGKWPGQSVSGNH